MLRSAELQISRLCSAKDGAVGAGGLVLSRAWTSSGTGRPWRPARATEVLATTKHLRSALRMWDVDRTLRPLTTSRHSTFSHTREVRNDQRA